MSAVDKLDTILAIIAECVKYTSGIYIETPHTTMIYAEGLQQKAKTLSDDIKAKLLAAEVLSETLNEWSGDVEWGTEHEKALYEAWSNYRDAGDGVILLETL